MIRLTVSIQLDDMDTQETIASETKMTSHDSYTAAAKFFDENRWDIFANTLKELEKLATMEVGEGESVEGVSDADDSPSA